MQVVIFLVMISVLFAYLVLRMILKSKHNNDGQIKFEFNCLKVFSMKLDINNLAKNENNPGSSQSRQK